jgi:hypothetical protein
MAPGIPPGPTDLFLPIIPKRFLIMPVLMVKGLSEWVEIINAYHKLETHGKIKNVDKYTYDIQCKNQELHTHCGLGSVVGIATGYRLDGLGIESRCVCEISRTCPDRTWGPSILLYNGYRVFPGVKSGRGVTLTVHFTFITQTLLANRKKKSLVQNNSDAILVCSIYHLH